MYLENKQGGHNKFYEIWSGSYFDKQSGKTNTAFVGSRFGRIGTQGRTIFKNFTGKYCTGDAHSFFHGKVEEKLRRGYEVVKER